VIPLALLALGTVVLRALDVDLAVAHWLYRYGHFFETEHGPLGILYRFAPVPGLALGLAALGLLVAVPWSARTRRHWRAWAFLVALLALGPGLLVNGILKDYTGRPRPYQIQDFGGPYPYRPVFRLGPPGEGYSFPSGHATIAFYLMSPFFLCWRRHRRCAWLSLAVGLAWGTLIGLVRMLQGGHFASDVLWAAGVVYLLGWLLWWVLRPEAPWAGDA